MATHPNTPPNASGQPPHRWPWFVLGAVLLAIVLAVLWMSREVERTRRIRDLNTPAPPPAATNRALPQP